MLAAMLCCNVLCRACCVTLHCIVLWCFLLEEFQLWVLQDMVEAERAAKSGKKGKAKKAKKGKKAKKAKEGKGKGKKKKDPTVWLQSPSIALYPASPRFPPGVCHNVWLQLQMCNSFVVMLK